METRVLTTHVPTQMAEALDSAAERLERSRAWVVKQALSNWLEDEKKRHLLTLKSIQQSKEGHMHSHEEVGQWVKSLK